MRGAGWLCKSYLRADPKSPVMRENDSRAHPRISLRGYPMITQPEEKMDCGELHVGSFSIFAAAGFTGVSRPTPRRVVMRIDF